MPLGSPPRPIATDAPAGPAPASLPVPLTGDDPLVAQLALTPTDAWVHESAQLVAGEVTRLTGDVPYDVLEVLELEGVEILIGLDRSPTADAYDVLHPGSGELLKTIPPTRSVYLTPNPTSPAPTRKIEVYTYSGRYAARLVG